MATPGYLRGRQEYGRPQAMLWSENPGSLLDGIYVPNGFEVGGYSPTSNEDELNQFLILSDDNRGEISITPTRIEKRERMVNGRMRSYHIADKLTITTSWNLLPSRSYALRPDFDVEGGTSSLQNSTGEYTSDGGAGGNEILRWYNNHQGPFWVYLAYDNYQTFGDEDAAYAHLPQYNQLVEMYFADFSYSVVTRGSNNFDFWNISVTLEEV